MKKSTRKYEWICVEYCWNLGEIRVDMDDICVNLDRLVSE